MGYDMRMVDDSDYRTSTDEEIAAAWDAAKADPMDNKLWMKAYRMEYPAEGYFRLNGGGMRAVVDAMAEVGMAYWENSPVNWGEVPKYPEDDEDNREVMAAYQAERDQHLSVHVGDSDVIPSYKFSTNDGWVVTPAEIRAALEVWDLQKSFGIDMYRISEDTRETLESDYWSEWIDYLRRSETHGGFRVN